MRVLGAFRTRTELERRRTDAELCIDTASHGCEENHRLPRTCYLDLRNYHNGAFVCFGGCASEKRQRCSIVVGSRRSAEQPAAADCTSSVVDTARSVGYRRDSSRRTRSRRRSGCRVIAPNDNTQKRLPACGQPLLSYHSGNGLRKIRK